MSVGIGGVASRRGVIALLVVRVVVGADGRSWRIIKHFSALVGDRGTGSSRSSRSGGRSDVDAHWAMTLVGVDIQEAEVAVVVLLEVKVDRTVCGRVVNAAGERVRWRA